MTNPLQPDEHRLLLLSVGTHRGQRPLSPCEVSGLFRRVISAGGDLEYCAKLAQVDSTSIVSRFLALQRLPVGIRELVDWGQSPGCIGFTAAFELTRLKLPSEQEAAGKASLEHRFTSAEVRQLVQLRIRAQVPIAECVAAVIRMRPQLDVRHVFMGAITDAGILAILKLKTQSDRDRLLGMAIQGVGVAPAGRILGLRLGSNQFTIVGDQTFGGWVDHNREQLEVEVNRELAKCTGA